MTEFVQQLLNGLFLGSIYALIALGYTMVYGVLRFINFAHGDVFMLGAFAGLYVMKALGSTLDSLWWPFSLLIVLASSMIVCSGLGMLIEFLAYRPLRDKPRLNVLITAIGVSLFLEYTGQLVFGATQQSFRSPVPSGVIAGLADLSVHWADVIVIVFYGILIGVLMILAPKSPRWTSLRSNRALTVFTLVLGLVALLMVGRVIPSPVLWDLSGLAVNSTQVIVLVTSLVLMFGLRFIVLNTKMGLAMRALSLNPTASALMGVNNNVVISFTFGLGSALAAAGGILYASLYPSIEPFMGIMPGLKAFVAAVLGGIGNIPGAALGGMIIGVTETLVAGYGQNIGIPSGYKDGVAFIILILILLFRPSGLLGKVEREKV